MITEQDLPCGGWIVEVVVVRQAGQRLVGERDLAQLGDVLRDYRPVLYVRPNTYTVELFVASSRSLEDARQLAVELVNDALRRADLPLWPIAEVKISEAKDGPCREPEADREGPASTT